jgi:hypothetical protein
MRFSVSATFASLNIAMSKGYGKRRSATPRPLGSIADFKEWYGNSRVA